MSVYLLPNKLVEAIEKMINAFWWGHGGSIRKGLHWLSWERLSIYKNYGGKGFKDLTSFNVAMLGKQGWKFQVDNTSLVSRLFKARYFPQCDFLSSRLGANPSYVWRSVFSAKMVVKQGARWRIGSGASIPLIGAPWLKDGCSLSTQSPLYVALAHVKVQDIIEPSTKVLNATLISNMFDHNTTQLILNTPLHPLVHEDKIIWKAEK